MQAWMWIALVLAVAAIAAPLLMRSLSSRDPAKVEAERREQKEVLEHATRLLDGVLQTMRDGGKVQTGPGTALHEEMAQIRPRIRKVFTLSAASEFDREIAFELNRPGVLALSAAAVQTRVERALGALRNAMPQ